MTLINLNQINITDSSGATALEGSVLIASQADDNVWSSNIDGALKIPSGDNSARDSIITSPVDGYIRHNTMLDEFEVYVLSDWRPIGQYTQDGTEAEPSRSFVNNQDTGTYLDSSAYVITVDATKRLEIDDDSGDTTLNIRSLSTNSGILSWQDDVLATPDAYISYNHSTDVFEISGNGLSSALHIDNSTNDVTVDNDLIVDGTQYIGDPGSETIEQLPAGTITLTGGSTNVNLPSPLQLDTTTHKAMIVEYSVFRSSDLRQVGTIYFASDGSTFSFNSVNAQVTGNLSFSGTMSGTTAHIRYTLSAGSDATMKYTLRRWDT